VTEADMQEQWKEWDDRVRRNSNYERTLADTIREQGTSEAEFRVQMRHLLRKERVAEHPRNLGKTLPEDEHKRLQQVGIVITSLRKGTTVEYGVVLQEHLATDPPGRPAALGPGEVARVNGRPVTAKHFGEQLVLRLPSDDLREILEQECKSMLMATEGVHLTDAQLQEEIDHLRALWPLDREFQQQVAWRTVSFPDRFQAEFKMTEEEVKESPFYRGLFGLVRRMRAQVTPERVAKDYEDGRHGRYGSHLVVTDVQIQFAQEQGPFQAARLRSRAAALQAAKEVVQSLARGASFEKVVGEVNARQDRTFTAAQVRLYDRDQDRILYDHASRMRDGDVSSPVETLSEVHILRREESRPARTLEEVRPLILEHLARGDARDWLEKRVNDPVVVQMRWPIAQRE
jgi:hypothetical protein